MILILKDKRLMSQILGYKMKKWKFNKRIQSKKKIKMKNRWKKISQKIIQFLMRKYKNTPVAKNLKLSLIEIARC